MTFHNLAIIFAVEINPKSIINIKKFNNPIKKFKILFFAYGLQPSAALLLKSVLQNSFALFYFRITALKCWGTVAF